MHDLIPSILAPKAALGPPRACRPGPPLFDPFPAGRWAREPPSSGESEGMLWGVFGEGVGLGRRHEAETIR